VARRPLFSPGRVLRRHRGSLSRRLLTNRAVAEALISVAGLVGRPVRNPAGSEVGRVVDVVARWDDGAPYPPVTGLVVRIGGRRAYVPIAQVAEITHQDVRLASARLDLEDFQRREGELTLSSDVIDHQMVDVDGVRVIRAADLYLAEVAGVWRLVGVDVGLQTLARRLGPARWRGRPTPDRVIDWAAIQPFGGSGGPERPEGPGAIRLRRPNQELKRLHPSELADLLEDLGHRERHELLAALEPRTAADALEEMEAEELGALLRQAPTEQAAALVAGMEPDEAADALRDLTEEDRTELLEAMPAEDAQRLSSLLSFPEGTAGGLMTTVVITAKADQTVAEVRERLRQEAEHGADIDAVLVVDDEGRLLDDVRLFNLLLAAPTTTLGALVGPPWPVVVDAAAALGDVVQGLVDNRHSSIVVVDEAGRPIGRILADDVVDALVPGRGRFHFPRLS
jgi:CBS domain-containing protein